MKMRFVRGARRLPEWRCCERTRLWCGTSRRWGRLQKKPDGSCGLSQIAEVGIAGVRGRIPGVKTLGVILDGAAFAAPFRFVRAARTSPKRRQVLNYRGARRLVT